MMSLGSGDFASEMSGLQMGPNYGPPPQQTVEETKKAKKGRGPPGGRNARLKAAAAAAAANGTPLEVNKPACTHCRKSKVKCQGGIPCQRCVVMKRGDTCERCIPRRRGRLKQGAGSSQDADAQDTPKSSTEKTGSKKPTRKRGPSRKALAAAESMRDEEEMLQDHARAYGLSQQNQQQEQQQNRQQQQQQQQQVQANRNAQYQQMHRSATQLGSSNLSTERPYGGTGVLPRSVPNPAMLNFRGGAGVTGAAASLSNLVTEKTSVQLLLSHLPPVSKERLDYDTMQRFLTLGRVFHMWRKRLPFPVGVRKDVRQDDQHRSASEERFLWFCQSLAHEIRDHTEARPDVSMASMQVCGSLASHLHDLLLLADGRSAAWQAASKHVAIAAQGVRNYVSQLVHERMPLGCVSLRLHPRIFAPGAYKYCHVNSRICYILGFHAEQLRLCFTNAVLFYRILHAQSVTAYLTALWETIANGSNFFSEVLMFVHQSGRLVQLVCNANVTYDEGVPVRLDMYMQPNSEKLCQKVDELVSQANRRTVPAVDEWNTAVKRMTGKQQTASMVGSNTPQASPESKPMANLTSLVNPSAAGHDVLSGSRQQQVQHMIRAAHLQQLSNNAPTTGTSSAVASAAAYQVAQAQAMAMAQSARSQGPFASHAGTASMSPPLPLPARSGSASGAPGANVAGKKRRARGEESGPTTAKAKRKTKQEQERKNQIGRLHQDLQTQMQLQRSLSTHQSMLNGAAPPLPSELQPMQSALQQRERQHRQPKDLDPRRQQQLLAKIEQHKQVLQDGKSGQFDQPIQGLMPASGRSSSFPQPFRSHHFTHTSAPSMIDAPSGLSDRTDSQLLRSTMLAQSNQQRQASNPNSIVLVGASSSSKGHNASVPRDPMTMLSAELHDHDAAAVNAGASRTSYIGDLKMGPFSPSPAPRLQPRRSTDDGLLDFDEVMGRVAAPSSNNDPFSYGAAASSMLPHDFSDPAMTDLVDPFFSTDVDD